MGSNTAPEPAEKAGSGRLDTILANTIAGVLGAAAFAVSFTHVRDTAARAGQGGLVAVAIAVSVELMALAAITEIRRRTRRGEQARWPRCVLVLGVAMSLASNLATAQHTTWGYVMAGWPAIAFLAVAGMLETRPTTGGTAGQHTTGGARTEQRPIRTGDENRPPARAGKPVDAARTEAAGGGAGHPYVRAVNNPPAATANGRRQAVRGQPPETARPAGAHTGSSGEGRPSRSTVRRELVAVILADPHWRPDYGQLAVETGYGRSWLEKRVAEARQAAADDTDTDEPDPRPAAVESTAESA